MKKGAIRRKDLLSYVEYHKQGNIILQLVDQKVNKVYYVENHKVLK
jgi:hypothetical protein